jgi:mitochondrial Rho GTPase 1
MKDSVRIVVVGDEKVGKTSIIEVLITNHFEEVVQHVLPVVVVPEDATPEHVHVSIVDTPGGAAGMPKVDEALATADVVVLVYAVDDATSIGRVCSFWLAKFRAVSLAAPIILVGNKIDTRGGITDPRAAESMEAFIKPIMDDYREVEVCIECSAKTVSNIPEVFYFAQKSVLHPTGPLYNVDTHSLTVSAAAALRRIFTMCDRDRDGALNDKELNDFQFRCFNIHLAPDELDGVKKVVKENRPDGGLTKDGFLSAEGFLYLHMLFVQKGRLETTWIVLRKFGYTDDLRLALTDSDKLAKADDQSVELTPSATAFLTERFEAADRDCDSLLSPSELSALFADCPDGPFPSPSTHFVAGADETTVREYLPNSDAASVIKVDRGFIVSAERVAGPQPEEQPSKAGYMTFEAYMARWAMLVQESPDTGMLALLYIGFSEPPLSAVKTTKPRKRDRYNHTVSRSVFNIAVVGDPEIARADIVRGLAGVKSTGLASPGVAAASEVDVDEAFGGGKRTLIMRDVPEADVTSLLSTRRELESVDVMCIVFNSASVESLEQAQRVYLALTSKGSTVRMPVVFVSCRTKEGAEDLPKVMQTADVFCEENGLAAAVRISPRDDDFGTLYSDLVGVALHPQVACPEYYDSADSTESSTASTILKVTAVVALVGGVAYAAKYAYDTYTTKASSAS